MITVTGATGEMGRRVAERLAAAVNEEIRDLFAGRGVTRHLATASDDEESMFEPSLVVA